MAPSGKRGIRITRCRIFGRRHDASGGRSGSGVARSASASAGVARRNIPSPVRAPSSSAGWGRIPSSPVRAPSASAGSWGCPTTPPCWYFLRSQINPQAHGEYRCSTSPVSIQGYRIFHREGGGSRDSKVHNHITNNIPRSKQGQSRLSTVEQRGLSTAGLSPPTGNPLPGHVTLGLLSPYASPRVT
ncbi:hypothetical protein EJB05_29093, partial [Eragrostis curvula]